MTNYPILDAQLADGPQGAWSLQETSGTSMADVSGNGRNGTYTNVTFNQPPVFSPALRSTKFASGAIGIIPYGSWLNGNEWTAEAAIYINSFTEGPQLIINRDWDPAEGRPRVFQFGMNGRAGKRCLTTTVWNASSNMYTLDSPDNSLNLNTPYLVAVRYKLGELSLWINGVKVNSMATSGNAKQQTAGRLFIGNYTPEYNFQALANISHAVFYNTALSDARLLAHATPSPDSSITAGFTQENITFALTQTVEQDVQVTAGFTLEDYTLACDVMSMDADITAPFEQENLVFGADPYSAGDVEQTAAFEVEELTMFGAVNGVQIVEASENYIVEDVVFAMVPQYVDIYEVTAGFTVEDLILEADNDADTPITPDPFNPTLIDVQMFCLIQALPPYDLPPGGLLTYDGSEYLIEADTGWEPAI